MPTIEKLLIRKASSQILEVSITDVPSGTLVDKAYFMVKELANEADVDAVISKTITTVESASGQITDTGASGTATLEFILDNDDVDPLSLTYLYMSCVKVILDNGMAYLPSYTRRPTRALPAVIGAID